MVDVKKLPAIDLLDPMPPWGNRPIKDRMSVMVAIDTPDKEEIRAIVEATCRHTSAYKVGRIAAAKHGWEEIARFIREVAGFRVKLFADPQKWPTDIKEVSIALAQIIYDAGYDAIIMFPLSGWFVQMACIEFCRGLNWPVWSGGDFTVEGARIEDGGYLGNIDLMFQRSARMGVRGFIVPGNQENRIIIDLAAIQEITGDDVIDLGSPGFGEGFQGGKVGTAKKAVKKMNLHVIAGRKVASPKTRGGKFDALLGLRRELGIPDSHRVA